MAADHLAAILLGDVQLQHHGLVVLLEFVNLDLVGVIDQCLGQELEQFFQALIPFALSSLLTVFVG